jgi:hypothetical protein
MRLVKESVLRIWLARKAEVTAYTADLERRRKSIEQKLDRLDQAFLFAQTIDVTTYEKQRDRLREELTLVQIDHHGSDLDKLDVEGILAFAERILPRAADLWVHASLDQRQQLQRLFFPEGIAFHGKRFVRTAVTAPAFSYLTAIEPANSKVVDQAGIEPATS